MAENTAFAPNLAMVIDAFPACFAHNALTLEARHFFGPNFDDHLLPGEQFVITKFAISEHLLCVLVLEFRMQPAGQIFRGFKSCDADGALGLKIDKRRRHFSPVAELQSTLAEPAPGHDADSIGSTSIDLDVSHQSLAIGATWILDAQLTQTAERHANSEHLACAEMTMGLFRFNEQLVELFHAVTNWMPYSSSPVAMSVEWPKTVKLTFGYLLGMNVTFEGVRSHWGASQSE